MALRLVIVEQASLPAELGSTLDTLTTPAGFALERVRWAAELRLDTCTAPIAAVLPVVDAEPAAAAQIVEWLARQPIAYPTMAIADAQASADVLTPLCAAVDDFLLWPAAPAELPRRLARLVGGPPAEDTVGRLAREMQLANLVGTSPRFIRVLEQLPALARSDYPVLITGETGTGKEVCARAIHHLSRRRDAPFVPVDCAALPDQLLENEVFGHTRGAFTDAHRDHRGLAAFAEGGTLFLDEVDALSPAAQAKLLRFAQERAYRPLGGERLARADVRMIAASNRDLEGCVRERTFRADFFFRLNVLRLDLPPLRERRGDVRLLAERLLELASREEGGGLRRLSETALARLTAYDWPGNVRELANVIQRAVALCPERVILPHHLAVGHVGTVPEAAPRGFRDAKAAAIATFEREYVATLLAQCQGNVTQAARTAGKDRRAFGRLVKKYRLGG